MNKDKPVLETKMPKIAKNQEGYTPAPISNWFRGKLKGKKFHCKGSNRNPSQSVQGYTLIEVAVSLFVVSVVLLIYAASSNLTVLNRGIKYQQLANRIAVSTMEDLLAAPFNATPASGPLSHSLLDQLPQGQGSVTVTDTFETGDESHLKTLVVTVSWKEPGSAVTRQATLTSYKNKYGL